MPKLKCNWCKDTGKLSLKSRGAIECLNCKGSGKGVDGGDEGQVCGSTRKPWLLGNKHGCKKVAV